MTKYPPAWFVWIFVSSNEALLAFATGVFTSLKYHWYWSGAPPLAATPRLAVSATVSVRSCGSTTSDGGGGKGLGPSTLKRVKTKFIAVPSPLDGRNMTLSNLV